MTTSRRMIPGWKRVDCPICRRPAGKPCEWDGEAQSRLVVAPHAERKRLALQEHKADLDPRDLE